jgi:4-carboxymuconolactone decarboxylase
MNRNTITIRAILSAFMWVALFSPNLRAQDRMPPIPAERMTDAQKKAAADFRAVRNSDPTGPFAVFLRVPELMDLTFKWRQHVQSRCVLDQRQAELVILVTARHWTQQYEWNAHEPLATKAGLKADIIAALSEGRRPDRMAEDEAILYDLITELQRNHAVSDGTYARALAKFGEPGIVEATSMSGYYAMLAMVMNTARTALPGGAKSPLAPFPY